MRVRHNRTGRIIRWRIGLQNPPWVPIDQPAPKVDSLEVPSGTVAEILQWAGDDPARRRAAKIAEQAGKNRKSLLDAL